MGSIIWVASYPKSGNTWVRLFLGTLVSARATMERIGGLGNVAPFENAGYFYQPFLPMPVGEASLRDLARVRPQVHRALARAIEGSIFLKTHMVVGRHLGTPTITGDVTSAAIYIVRNPLDVVVSYAAFRNWSIEQAIEVVNTPGRILSRSATNSYLMTGSWSENVRSWTRRPSDRLCVLRYEDLLERPLEEFTRLVRFLHMDADGEAIERAVELASFDNLKRAEQQAGFGEKPSETSEFFRVGRKEQWRTALTEAQVSAVTLRNAPEMQRFGYWEDGFDRYGDAV